MKTSQYLPAPAEVIEARPMTERETYFRVRLPEPLGHKPGQFVMVSLFGLGEAPISVSCGPHEGADIEMVIREAGSLTRALCRLRPGEFMGVRGPYGTGFDLQHFYDRDVLFVCGGLGLAPLRSLIQAVLSEPVRFGEVTIVSGCRTPADELYRDELTAWAALPKVTVIRTVDSTEHQPWRGRVGLVTAPLDDLELAPERTTAALCGPPVMYKFVMMSLLNQGIDPDSVFVDLERRMRCGVGKCGHCQINHIYCCQEGPVFQVNTLTELQEAFR